MNQGISERVHSMRHESERAGQGTRGSEGERGQEPERGKGVGATGGRGDCRNKAGKGKKGRYYRRQGRALRSVIPVGRCDPQKRWCTLTKKCGQPIAVM